MGRENKKKIHAQSKTNGVFYGFTRVIGTKKLVRHALSLFQLFFSLLENMHFFRYSEI